MTLKARALSLPGTVLPDSGLPSRAEQTEAQSAADPKAPQAAPHIRIIAPASHAQPARLARGAAALRAGGYRVSFGEHAEARLAPYFSASVEHRLADLHAAFADPSVDIVMCTRGGYGSNYLLSGLDLALIAAHPKPLFGYSDITAIETWLMDQIGLVVFHGPMLAADFYRELPHAATAGLVLEDSSAGPGIGVDHASFHAALTGGPLLYTGSHGLRTLRPGRAQGTLYGGCLTLLAASLGTRFSPCTEGKLLFLEDVGAKPYQVDRLLRQLRLAGKLKGVPGIIFGEMLDCLSAGAAPGLLEDAILGALECGRPGGFSGPVAIGLRSGHVTRANVTLPLNVEAELILKEGEPALRLCEPAVRISA